MKKIGLGGGCHWCTEGVFQSLEGVLSVDQGWIKSKNNNSSYSEAVIVAYNPGIVSLDTLIEIHILTHSSSSNHSMRSKYRSAIYFFDDEQQKQANFVLSELNTGRKEKIITQVIKFDSFKLNDLDNLNYYRKNRNAPFCETYIKPKLMKLLKSHREYIKKGEKEELLTGREKGPILSQ